MSESDGSVPNEPESVLPLPHYYFARVIKLGMVMAGAALGFTTAAVTFPLWVPSQLSHEYQKAVKKRERLEKRRREEEETDKK